VREPVVPLINVVFLLLVFFMLTATPGAPDDRELRLPSVPSIGERERIEVPVLHLDAAGRLALADRPVAAGALTELGPRVELRADARAPARVLLPLLERLASAGVAQVELVTRVP